MSLVLLPSLLLAAAATTPVQAFLPCRPGLEIEYRWRPQVETSTPTTRVDRVQRLEGRLCFIRRTVYTAGTRTDRDVFVREMLTDRILDAGWQGALTAFRAPLLRAPLADGQRWRFNRVDYRVEHLDEVRTPAGRFDAVVRVHAESVPRGRFRAVRTYARGVGLVEDRRNDGAWVAVAIRAPPDQRPGIQR